MSKEDEDRDAILKELHNDDSNSSEDEDLNIANLKKQMTQKKTPEKEASAEKGKEEENPLSDEQKRHKDNLMADIYDQISDEDDEEEEKVNSDNPFQQQMM